MSQTTRFLLFSFLMALTWLAISRGYILLNSYSRNWAFNAPTFWLVITIIISMITAGYFIFRFNKTLYKSTSKKIGIGILMSLTGSTLLVGLRLLIPPTPELLIELKSFLFYTVLGTLAAVTSQLKYLFEKDSG